MTQGLIFNEKRINELISALDFTKANGLISVITQDYETGEVLMVAYANEDALRQTLRTGKAHYWSRSRKELWEKGKTSGHQQHVQEILFDCDADALILKVKQIKAACHTGYFSCFYRSFTQEGIKVMGKPVFDPKLVYKEKK